MALLIIIIYDASRSHRDWTKTLWIGNIQTLFWKKINFRILNFLNRWVLLDQNIRDPATTSASVENLILVHEVLKILPTYTFF